MDKEVSPGAEGKVDMTQQTTEIAVNDRQARFDVKSSLKLSDR